MKSGFSIKKVFSIFVWSFIAFFCVGYLIGRLQFRSNDEAFYGEAIKHIYPVDPHPGRRNALRQDRQYSNLFTDSNTAEIVRRNPTPNPAGRQGSAQTGLRLEDFDGLFTQATRAKDPPMQPTVPDDRPFLKYSCQVKRSVLSDPETVDFYMWPVGGGKKDLRVLQPNLVRDAHQRESRRGLDLLSFENAAYVIQTAGGYWTLKELSKGEKNNFEIAAAVIGILSGWSEGHDLGTHGLSHCNSDAMLAKLNSESAWETLERRYIESKSGSP